MPVEAGGASSQHAQGLYAVTSSQHLKNPDALATPKVAILMCTFNGERFLDEQLASIEQQTHTNWTLHISDDGSRDNTLPLLRKFQAKWGSDRVTLYAGPKTGFVANFLSLTCNPDIQADHYAYADQDDIWETDKLSRALAWLQTTSSNTASLYCSRTRLIDEKGREIGFSPLFKKQPCFRNALVQSIAGANTMVFNQTARLLLMSRGEKTSIVSHDWWAYLLVTGVDGNVYYDPTPGICYRQHGNNLVGSNADWRARWRRMVASLQGRFTDWNDTNLAALSELERNLATDNQATLTKFMSFRKSSMTKRVTGVLSSGLYRQTVPGNISLFVAALLGKL